MDIEEEASVAVKLRIRLETKVRELIPDSGDKEADQLSAKLTALNKQFSGGEQAASKSFLFHANTVIHNITERLSEYKRETMEQDYDIISRAIDRIIERSRVKPEEEKKAEPQYEPVRSSGLSDWQWILAFFLGLMLLRMCAGG